MKIKTTFFLYILLFLSGNIAYAQNDVASITKILQNDSIIEITITSTAHFRAGANPYVLHIGDHVFSLSKEPKNGEGKALTFYVPISEFRELINGTEAILVYGFYQENIESKNIENKEIIGKHWQLGKLDKTLETK